jgi:GNAT superfamily N-acetyltransferase
MTLTLSDATPADVSTILQFIRELAEYEKLLQEVVATEAMLHNGLFGDIKRAWALVAEVDDEPIGFSLWHYTFSTFSGSATLYVEDVYVRPQHRGAGVGYAIFRHLARLAVSQGCERMDWSVLDWNAPAIAFYGRIGARPVRGWTVQRLTGDALATLAG